MKKITNLKEITTLGFPLWNSDFFVQKSLNEKLTIGKNNNILFFSFTDFYEQSTILQKQNE